MDKEKVSIKRILLSAVAASVLLAGCGSANAVSKDMLTVNKQERLDTKRLIQSQISKEAKDKGSVVNEEKYIFYLSKDAKTAFTALPLSTDIHVLPIENEQPGQTNVETFENGQYKASIRYESFVYINGKKARADVTYNIRNYTTDYERMKTAYKEFGNSDGVYKVDLNKNQSAYVRLSPERRNETSREPNKAGAAFISFLTPEKHEVIEIYLNFERYKGSFGKKDLLDFAKDLIEQSY
ncbi:MULTISPECIES: hypothetical protein [Pseudobacillus]|uniref:hypothetical protein n=1 Tax=Pseudobacillus TaxID=108525 RepID=UPI00387A455E